MQQQRNQGSSIVIEHVNDEQVPKILEHLKHPLTAKVSQNVRRRKFICLQSFIDNLVIDFLL